MDFLSETLQASFVPTSVIKSCLFTNSGYVYDAAGNLISNGLHSFSYDADGNLTKIDNGSTATYTYDGLNRRVRVDAGGASLEYVFNPLADATALINGNANTLLPSEKRAIGEISAFDVIGSRTDLGATGEHSMTLSTRYINASSAAWIGSLFGHEGQHSLNHGMYSGENLWRDEQSAGIVQLFIGAKIGLQPYEIRHLLGWIDDSNKAAMQQHMLQSYSY